MHLGEEDAAYPPIDFSQVSYEGGMGGNLGYYGEFVTLYDIFAIIMLLWAEENTTDTQELEADHLNQDDFLRKLHYLTGRFMMITWTTDQIADIQEVEAGQPNQVEPVRELNMLDIYAKPC